MDISQIPERLTKNHKFTNHERIAIVTEYEKCSEPGEKSALCRWLKVDPSTVRTWGKLMHEGSLVASDMKQNSNMMKKRELADYRRLQRENAELKKRLEQSESAVEVLGKASELLTALAKSSQTRTEELPEQPPVPPAFRAPKHDASDEEQ